MFLITQRKPKRRIYKRAKSSRTKRIKWNRFAKTFYKTTRKERRTGNKGFIEQKYGNKYDR